uniref:RUN and FYVE domain containing 3 n=1 Tax=Callorhinchus milii TaxID=7868 RepID=A0A4W3JN31_CALMI
MSDLTPQSDVPTPTTDKITQAARETIYLCNFRVSVDGEWLCLRELNDISLTPDPEPTHEDPKDPIAIERLNLMNMAKLSIKGLIESALNLGRSLDSDYAPLQQFFVVMEHCLKHGLKAKKTFLGQNKSFWGPLELVEKLCPEAGEITVSVKDLPGLKTPVGRGRAWLRLALMQKKLSDYMKALINRKDLMSEFYEANALMMEEEGAVIAGLLVGLNVIDVNLCMKGEDLDTQVGVIDFSLYLKDGGHSSKSNEGDGQITAILDQKNYVEELNRHLSATVNNLQAKVDALEKSNTKLTEELAVANNRIITLQEETERIKQDNVYYLESTRKKMEVSKQDGNAEGNFHRQSHQDDMYNEARKQLKEETQLRLGSDSVVRQKNEIIARLEEKTNQMGSTIKQLEQRLRQVGENWHSAEDANRHFKQEFGDKIESLQLQVEQLTKERSQWEMVLKERKQNLHNDPHRDKNTGAHYPKLVVDMKKELQQLQEENAKLRKGPECKPPNVSLHQCRSAEEIKVEMVSKTVSCVLFKCGFIIGDCINATICLLLPCVSQESDQSLESSENTAVNIVCNLCQDEASVTKPKNRCHNCQEMFCNTCSANELPLPSSIKPERVCNPCHTLLLEQYSTTPP